MARDQSRLDLLQGTLDLMILRALRTEAMHGWAISERIQLISQDVLQVNQGSLYPALYRLERQEFIRSHWETTENNRRARYYELTATGRARLASARQSWKRMAKAVEVDGETIWMMRAAGTGWIPGRPPPWDRGKASSPASGS